MEKEHMDGCPDVVSSAPNSVEVEHTPLRLNDNYVLVGRRGTGKTVRILSMYRSWMDSGVRFKKATVFSPVVDTQLALVTGTVETELNLGKLKRIVQQIKSDKTGPYLLIFDDCAHDKNIMNSQEMRFLVLNGRNYGLTMILSMPNVHMLKPEYRLNIDSYLLFKENSQPNVKKLYDVCGNFRYHHIQPFMTKMFSLGAYDCLWIFGQSHHETLSRIATSDLNVSCLIGAKPFDLSYPLAEEVGSEKVKELTTRVSAIIDELVDLRYQLKQLS